MPLEYQLLDSTRPVPPEVEERVQRDLQKIAGRSPQLLEPGKLLYLVNSAYFDGVRRCNYARVLSYVPSGKRIHFANQIILGHYDLPRPLDQLTDSEVNNFSFPYNNQSFIEINMIHRLKELVTIPKP